MRKDINNSLHNGINEIIKFVFPNYLFLLCIQNREQMMVIKYTKGEERTNYISHAGGILLGLIVGICFLIFPLITSNLFLRFIDPNLSEYAIGWAHPWLCVIVSGFFILTLCLNQNAFAAKVLALKPFVMLGNVSYETYITHWYFLSSMAMSIHHHRHFLLVYLVTICVSFGLKKLIDLLFQSKQLIAKCR